MENASKYGGDPTRICVTGDSAGGHLSASVANFVERIGDRGFGKIEGVYEFLPTYMPKGKTVAQVREALAKAIKAAAPMGYLQETNLYIALRIILTAMK